MLRRAALCAGKVHFHDQGADVAHAHHCAADSREAAWRRGGGGAHGAAGAGRTERAVRANSGMQHARNQDGALACVVGPCCSPTLRGPAHAPIVLDLSCRMCIAEGA